MRDELYSQKEAMGHLLKTCFGVNSHFQEIWGPEKIKFHSLFCGWDFSDMEKAPFVDHFFQMVEDSLS